MGIKDWSNRLKAAATVLFAARKKDCADKSNGLGAANVRLQRHSLLLARVRVMAKAPLHVRNRVELADDKLADALEQVIDGSFAELRGYDAGRHWRAADAAFDIAQRHLDGARRAMHIDSWDAIS